MNQLFLRMGLALSLAACSAPCLAMNQPPSSSSPLYSIDTKIDKLLANPVAAQIVKAFVQKQRVAAGKPELTPEQQSRLIGVVGDMTPREVSKFPQVHMNAAALNELNMLLAQIPVPTEHASAG